MDHHNELTHYWTIKLFGVERKLGFTEWQCVLASVISGMFWFDVGLSLEIYLLSAPHPTSSERTGVQSLIDSNAFLLAYFNLVAFLMPWMLMVGSITLYRKYRPLFRIFLALFVLATVSRSDSSPMGQLNSWYLIVAVGFLSLSGLWGFFAGTIKTLQDWYWRFANRRTEAA